jgi:uncharacterized RDD family membrane protein YckC
MPRPEPTEEPLLFDLPLDISGVADSDGTAETTGRRRHRPAGMAMERKRPPAQQRPDPLAAAPVPQTRGTAAVAEPEEDEEPSPEPADGGGRNGAGNRIAAGTADLLVHAAVAVVLLVGTRMMGVRATLADWPAFALFLLAFSFLYMVVPLAFWGHTLGMAWAGLVARNRDGEPLTFDQTARRWLGGMLTLALAGLPLLLTGQRRSLTDLLSGSATYPSRA